jgi:predicted glycoside hydrolase/deacetylase ChbG (UPF0249 family)
MNEAPPRRIWLCADDYGIAPGVNAAIRDLIAQGRLNATSVMTVAPAFNADEVSALKEAAADRTRVAIGLHLTLTAPFKPSVNGFRPLREGSFAPVMTTLKDAMLRRFDSAALRAEVQAQIAGFTHAFAGPPAFVDGHQHVHLFPQIREVVLETVQEAAPEAWVRQCGWPGRRPSLRDPKGLLIGWFSRDLRREAQARELQVNPAFAGTYTYSDTADFAALFPGFVQGMPENGLVMCHPGKVDDTLRRLDPLTDTREREYAYLSGAAFPRALAEAGVTLA